MLADSQSASTADQAFSRIVAMTGFGESDLLRDGQTPDSIAVKSVMKDSTVSFARRYIDGRVAWHFVFNDVIVDTTEFPNPDFEDSRRMRRIEVWVDSSDGSLLLIRSFRQSGLEHTDAEPPWSEVFCPMAPLREAFYGFPEVNPQITLQHALGLCKGSPVGAEVWSAAYVMYSQRDSEPVPAWVFHFAGVYYPRAHFNSTEDAPSAHRRVVVDAITGNRLVQMWYEIDPTADPESKD